jgi:hypothetical protein
MADFHLPPRWSRQVLALRAPDNADVISSPHKPIVMFTFIHRAKYPPYFDMYFDDHVPPYHVTIELTSIRHGTSGNFR